MKQHNYTRSLLAMVAAMLLNMLSLAAHAQAGKNEEAATPKGAVAQEEVEYYGITIGGVELTSANYKNISAEGGFPAVKSGKVTYLPEFRELRLVGAVIEATGTDTAIDFYKDVTSPLTSISITSGDGNGYTYSKSEIKADMTAIKASCNLAILGRSASHAGPLTSHQLSVKSANDCGIYVTNGKFLRIASVGLLQVEGVWGISGTYGKQEELRIEHSNISAKGSKGSICDFKTITRNDNDKSEIIAPTGAVIEGGDVVLDGAVCTEEVVIGYVYYGLRIGGVEVMSCNYQNLSYNAGDFWDIVKGGQVTFDPETNTLTLKDAIVDGDRHWTHGIEFYDREREFTLVLEGESQVTVTDKREQQCGLTTSCYLHIVGRGEDAKAKFSAEKECGLDVRNGGNLTISDCTIEARGGGFGLCGNARKEGLQIENANVTAQGSRYSMGYFSDISLVDCELVAPEEAVIWEGDVRLGGEITNHEVVIRSTGQNAVESILASEKGATGIYDLKGQRIGEKWENLPRGVYIVDGKKVVK